MWFYLRPVASCVGASRNHDPAKSTMANVALLLVRFPPREKPREGLRKDVTMFQSANPEPVAIEFIH